MIKIVLKFNMKEVLIITTATKETIDKIVTTMQADAVIGDLESITAYFHNWNEEVEILVTTFDHAKMLLYLECLDNPSHFEYTIY